MSFFSILTIASIHAASDGVIWFECIYITVISKHIELEMLWNDNNAQNKYARQELHTKVAYPMDYV